MFWEVHECSYERKIFKSFYLVRDIETDWVSGYTIYGVRKYVYMDDYDAVKHGRNFYIVGYYL